MEIILIFVVIIVASLFAVMNQKNSNNKELFTGIYNEAKEKYDEGQSLKDLNASLAQENFEQAQQILEKNKDFHSLELCWAYFPLAPCYYICVDKR